MSMTVIGQCVRPLFFLCSFQQPKRARLYAERTDKYNRNEWHVAPHDISTI